MFRNKWICFADGGGSAEVTKTDDNDDKKNIPPDDNKKGNGEADDKKPFATFPDESSFVARVKQAANSELKSLAESLGFESVDAMQAAAKKVKEIEEKNKTDLEKEKERADTAEKKNATITETANQKLINAELKVFAAQSKFVDPEDVVALADRSKIEVDENGTVTGAKEAVEALAKVKPHLVGTGKKNEIGAASNPGGDGDTMTEEEIGKKLAEDRVNEKKQIDKNAFDPWAS